MPSLDLGRLIQRLRRRRGPLSRAAGWVVDELDIIRKYRRLRPDHLSLAGSRHALFVNPADRRGRFLLRHSELYAAHLKEFWRWSADVFAPSLVIDLGLNYGEFLFSGTYPTARRVVGIEANMGLEPWIVRSSERHPNSDAIEIHYVIATDKSHGDAVLYRNTRWSGTSSVSASHERWHVPVTVARTRLTTSSAPASHRKIGCYSRLTLRAMNPQSCVEWSGRLIAPATLSG